MSVLGVCTTPSSAAFLQPASAALSRPARPPPSEVAKGRMRAALALMVAFDIVQTQPLTGYLWPGKGQSESEKPPGSVAGWLLRRTAGRNTGSVHPLDSDVTTILARRGARAIKSAILIRAISRIK